MTFFYDLLYFIAVVLYFPFFVARGKRHPGFSMRFGEFPAALRSTLWKRENIWIHAVSVGEVLAAKKLVEFLEKTFPALQIVISTVTPTGYAVAHKTFSSASIVFAPLDFSWVVRRYINLIKPRAYIAMETEIWPNLFGALKRNKVPILLVNGRISDKSFGRYRAAKLFLKPALNCVDIFLMQSERDAQRIKELGAHPQKVSVAGNMKFDDFAAIREIHARDLGFDANDQFLVAGSTHPGEEEILLAVYEALQKEFSALKLILAPRHIERTDEVLELVKQKGFSPVKFSGLKTGKKSEGAVVVLDVMGELKSLYSLAALVFVGKSLKGGGGQNIIEPACFAKPIFIGPHNQNFQDIVDIFKGEGAVVIIKDGEELLAGMRQLLKNPGEASRLGQSARSVSEKYKGASQKAAQVAAKLIAESV